MKIINKKYSLVIIFCLLILSAFSTYIITEQIFEHQFKIIYSLDKKQNDQEIIKVINKAHKYVYFAIFTFTKDNIADALIKAKERGVLVWGITDLEQTNTNNQSIVAKLRSGNIPIETQKHTDGIMHIKAVITEKAYAVGSYNWTQSATEYNDEILEVGTNNYIREKYLAIIEKLLVTNE